MTYQLVLAEFLTTDEFKLQRDEEISVSHYDGICAVIMEIVNTALFDLHHSQKPIYVK